MDNIAKTAKFWDQVEVSRPKQFWDLPVVQKYRNRLVSENEDLGYLEWFAEKYVKNPAKKGISIGCGSGQMDRTAIKLGLAGKMVGIDIAPNRLQKAEELSAGMPIEYFQQDLNRIHLKRDSYDFAICKTILHHIENLEHVLGELRKALVWGSLIYVDEYVGPKRFQFSEKVLSVADKVLQEIPSELRQLHYAPFEIKTKINRINAENLIAADPSEAVRSNEIDRMLKKYFNVLEERGAGGSLLFRLMDGICHNFDAGNKKHNQILKLLCDFEERLIKEKVIPEIFKVYVLKIKK